MNNMEFKINGFKCFDKENIFDLKQMTLLTGANSAGKSSVIQSLLLTKKAAESNDGKISFSDDEYSLDLGRYDDVVSIRSEGNISFNLNGVCWSIKAEDINPNDDGKCVKFRSERIGDLRKVFQTGFSFLSADRMAPRYEYKYSSGKDDLCNCQGNNFGDVLNRHNGDNIESGRSLIGIENKLKLLLDEWVDYIFPGVNLLIKNTGSDSYKVMEQGLFAATNIGFGITYALPILINGLLMSRDGWFIIENPEAHLHPKAQSNMGYFLACMASTGVRVIVETHSEHIVNGIRRFALKQGSQLKPDDVAIYFFKNNGGKREYEKIDIDENGNLSDLPVDFFDQVRQDMQQIIQLGAQLRKRND